MVMGRILLRSRFSIFLLVITALLPATVSAEQEVDQDQVQILRANGTILPLEEIVDAARRLHPGRLAEVELKQSANRYIYEIEIIDPQGQVWEMKFDAKSAALVSQEQED